MTTARLQATPPVETRGSERVIVLQRDGRYEPEPRECWQYLDHYFPADRWDEVYNRARAIADSWYRAPEIGGLLSFEGVSLAGALQWSVFSFALQVLRDLVAFGEIATRESAACLVVPPLWGGGASDRYDPGLTCELARQWAAGRGLRVEADGASLALRSRGGTDWLRPVRQLLAHLPDPSGPAGGDAPAILIADPVLTRLGVEVPRLLHERGYDVVVADRDPATIAEMTRAGVPVRSWRDFAATNLRRVHEKVRAQLQRALRTIPWSLIAQQAGVPAEAEGLFEQRMRGVWLPALTMQAEHLSRVGDVLQACEVKAGVMCYAWTGYERLLIERLRQEGIPTVTLIHGLVTDIREYLPVVTDFVGPIGEADCERFIAHGVPARAARSVGCPRFDAAVLARPEPEVKRGSEKVVLLATQAQSAAVQRPCALVPTRQLVRLVAAAVACEAGTQLVVRLHPAEDITAEEKAEWERLGICLAEGDLYAWLRRADVVLTQSSTVGLEVLLLDKPLVIINLTGTPDLIPYVAQGVAAGVYSEPDLLPTLRSALSAPPHRPESRELFILRYAGGLDGQATQRVAQYIADIADIAEGEAITCTSPW